MNIRLARFSAVCLFAFVLSLATNVAAQDNPVLRSFLSKMIKNELSKHSSESTAFKNSSEKKQVKWAKLRNPVTNKVIGKTIIAEWKESTASSVWFDDPGRNLVASVTLEKPEFVVVRVPDGHTVKTVEVPRVRISGGRPKVVFDTKTVKIPKYKDVKKKNDRFSFEVEVSAKVKCKASAKVRVASASLKAIAKARVKIAGSFTLKNGKLANAEISDFDAKLYDIKPNNDVVGVLKGQILDMLANHFLDKKENDLKNKVRDSINGKSI